MKDCYFGNLHPDFQSVSFLVQAVLQHTQEIVKLNGGRRIWSLIAILRRRTSFNEVFSRLRGTALAEVRAPQHTSPSQRYAVTTCEHAPGGKSESHRFSLTQGWSYQLDEL